MRAAEALSGLQRLSTREEQLMAKSTPAPDSAEFFGVNLSLATAYWCDSCGCLLTLDTSKAGPVADRFEYASHPDDIYSHADSECACHVAVALHNAADRDEE